MFRPPRPCRLALVALAALGASLAGCSPEPAPRAPRAWVRFDLAVERPAVEFERAGVREAYRQEIGFLGRDEVRDMKRVLERQLKVFPQRTSGQIRVLEQAAGTRLAWRLELGDEPYASFVPLGWDERPCDCTYRFGVRDARGGLHELHREPAARAEPFAPMVVTVDLGDFAGTEVEVLLQIEPARPVRQREVAPTVLWGSPAIYSRRPRDHHRRPDDLERPNVLVLGVDTLRADAVGAYRPDHSPSLTPAIDRLAEEGDLYLHAFSTFNVTNPSFASIFTGLYGKNHGVYDLQTPLPAAHTTLAEALSEAGYDTFAVISASHLGDHNSGLGQGFDQVTTASHHYAGELPVDAMIDWLAERARPGVAPFFAWLHLFDPHTPHTPPAPYSLGFHPERSRGLSPVGGWRPFRRPGERAFTEIALGGHRDLYAGEVAYLDRQIDRLIDFLASRDLLEETIVVLVADHGENLGEHGISSRHLGLWDTTTHVPLVVRWPGALEHPAGGPLVRGRRLPGLVQTLDLFPTLLAAAGVEPPPSDGADLVDLAGAGRRGRRVVFAEHAGASEVMVRDVTHKLIRRATSTGEGEVAAETLLFDLTEDPGETVDLSGRGHPAEARLSGILDRWLAERREAPATRQRDLPEEELEKLRALGYLN